MNKQILKIIIKYKAQKKGSSQPFEFFSDKKLALDFQNVSSEVIEVKKVTLWDVLDTITSEKDKIEYYNNFLESQKIK